MRSIGGGARGLQSRLTGPRRRTDRCPVLACRGLPQCQQKRPGGVSRARRRSRMSWAGSRAGGPGRRRRPGPAATGVGPGGQDGVEQVVGARVAGGDLRGHRLEHDVADRLGQLRVVQPRRGGELAAFQLVEVGRRRRLVGQPAGEQLVHRDADRVDVGGEDRLAVELLGGHVRRAADHRGAVSGDLEEPRGAEVGHLGDAVLGDDDVAGPQVAVDDPLAVRVIDRVADLAAVVEGLGQLERALAIRDRLERLARHVLHDDEEHLADPLGGEHGDDVGMAQRRQQPRLVQQLAEVERLAVGDLERDLLVDPGVLGQEDRAEPAAAERRQDLVLADHLVAEEHRPAV